MIGLVSTTILAFVGERSYAVHLENGLQETRENKAFVYKTTAMATGCIRKQNNAKSLITAGIKCCEKKYLD